MQTVQPPVALLTLIAVMQSMPVHAVPWPTSKANAPSGEITISGWIRAYSAINMYAGSSSSGSQDVKLTSTSLLETLSGGMILNPHPAMPSSKAI